MTHSERYDSTRPETNSFGVAQQNRQQILLDDLRHEVQRLADAVERHNELLAQQAGDQGHEEVE